MLKVEYFTEHAATKATIATAGVGAHVTATWICASIPKGCVFISWLPDQVLILFGMMALDMFTGVLASRQEGGRVTSRRLGEGVKRKIGMLSVVAAAWLLDQFFYNNDLLRIEGIVFTGAVGWFVAVEFLSLYENVERLGVRLPYFLKALMERVLQRADHAVRTQESVTRTMKKDQ